MAALNSLAEKHATPAVAPDDGAHWIAELTGSWWVLRTRAQSEKRVAAELERYQCCYYLPLVRVQHTYSRCRQAVFYKPLFAGYVFLNRSSWTE